MYFRPWGEAFRRSLKVKPSAFRRSLKANLSGEAFRRSLKAKALGEAFRIY